MRGRDQRRLERDLPLVASQMARDLRSGVTLFDALSNCANNVAGPVAEDLQRVVSTTQRGVPLANVLRAWRRARRSESVDLFVVACQFVHRHGGAATVAFDGVAAALTDRLEVADELRALTAQTRLSAAVLVSLPVVGVAAFSMLDPHVGTALLFTPAGWGCLFVGGALETLGIATVRRLVAAVSR